MIVQEPKDSATAEPGSELATLLGAHLTQILEQVSGLAEVHAERARRAFLRKAVGIALAAVAGIVLATLALLAAWQLGQGISQGLALLTGQPWLGDLLSGALLLALVLGAALLVLKRADPEDTKAREQAAWDGLKNSVTELGEELVRAGKLRERVRAHPYISLGAGLAAGIAAAPLLQGLLRHSKPLARAALSHLPGVPPSLQRAAAPRNPTSSAG